jgi:hypothetical protein
MPPLLLAVCLVAVGAAQLVIAVVAVRALSRFNRVTLELEKSAQGLRDCALQAKSVGHQVEGLVASLREIVPPVRRAAEAFGQIGERAADLSSAVLDEVERPVRRTLGLFRGVQAGASYFLNRLAHSGHEAKNGGNSHE